MKKILKVISNLITLVLFLNLILMAFLVISSKASKGETQLFGYQLKSVLSGSMEPTFLTGSIIGVKPLNSEARSKLKKDDIITFKTNEGILVTHRIIGVTESGQNILYVTKGDNNNASDQDPVLSDNVVAIYSGFTMPYIGYFINFAQSKEGTALLLVGPGILLLGYAAFIIYRGLKELDVKTKNLEKKEDVV
ncbi:signal peptidase I [Neobacillus novalis]|uniref:Signal peptidase I n=1 Tax=Neobacillus novalis TaxID=220687 RepID=A0AA95MT50_9BACI|nr:signal peptidase I [Neobacillus novalis]WHY87520.1 signal peptidase I [Neobacillus novalis]